MSHGVQSYSLPSLFPRIRWLVLVPALLILAFLLAWTTAGFRGLQGLGPFAVVALLTAVVMWAVWLVLSADRSFALPSWLAWTVVIAALLRLAGGVVWFTALPVFGYGNPAEMQGYVMADAHQRDQAAWELSRSDASLLQAFTGYRMADQYGGLLYLSALVYRYVGGGTHLPLQMVVIAAGFSALAVLFTWAFARRVWDEAAAKAAAWVLVLYPEAVLLGGSQMREAFTVTLTVAAFYGLVRYWQERTWPGLAWILGVLALSLPFSPPFSALLLGLLALQVVFMGGWQVLRRRRLWLILGFLAILAVTGAWLAWDQFAPQGVTNPVALFGWWLKKSAEWQAHLSESASGWIQKIFDRFLPAWAQTPFLILYGIVRPFLPAALLDTSAPIWKGIAIWRSLGWTALLAFLAYGSLLSWRLPGRRSAARGLSVVIWLVILLSSFRGGGDLWDGPRYRAAFAGLQAILAGWAWIEYRRSRDPWLRRILIGMGAMLAWFLPWYIRRYTPLEWPVVDLFKTIGLGLASAALLMFWDWVRGQSP